MYIYYVLTTQANQIQTVSYIYVNPNHKAKIFTFWLQQQVKYLNLPLMILYVFYRNCYCIYMYTAKLQF